FLVRLSGQKDLVVPVSAAGQNFIEDGNSLVGHCVRLLPIRVTISGNPTLKDYLLMIRRLLLDAQQYQSYPFIRLVRKLNLPRDPSSLPLASTDFNLDIAGTISFFDLELEIQNNITGFAPFDFSLNIVQGIDDLLIECSYNTDLFTTATIER